MTTFKFKGKKVTFENGKVHSDDEATQAIIAPLVRCALADGPEQGDPLLNTITRIFGEESVTDVVYKTPANLIY
jgi:hypothetical protein